MESPELIGLRKRPVRLSQAVNFLAPHFCNLKTRGYLNVVSGLCLCTPSPSSKNLQNFCSLFWRSQCALSYVLGSEAPKIAHPRTSCVTSYHDHVTVVYLTLMGDILAPNVTPKGRKLVFCYRLKHSENSTRISPRKHEHQFFRSQFESIEHGVFFSNLATKTNFVVWLYFWATVLVLC